MVWIKTVKAALLQLALTVLIQPLHAQSVAVDSARVESARAAVVAIPIGSRIRIETVGHSIIEGRLAARSDTGVVIRQKNDSSRASIARIATISTPAHNIKSGAIAGALTGGIISALLLGEFARGMCERADCRGAFADGAKAGAVLGGALGAAIGIGVGALTHHWERVWPSGAANP